MKAMMVLVVAATAGSLGCATLPTMRSGMPIEIDTSLGTPRYQQEGRGIDPADMASKLDDERRSSSYVKGSRALKVLSIAAALAAGALVGVPIGQAATGNRHPTWTLAGVGGGVFGGGIVLSVGSIVALDGAVEQHNRSFNPPGANDEP